MSETIRIEGDRAAEPVADATADAPMGAPSAERLAGSVATWAATPWRYVFNQQLMLHHLSGHNQALAHPGLAQDVPTTKFPE